MVSACFERFRIKARHFLRAHEDHVTIHKLRLNQALTPQDLDELARMLLQAGIATEPDIERARELSAGFGLFVRSLVGLDREAAKEAFGEFLSGNTASANQIEFINMLIDHLTEHGAVAPELLYQSPFTDLSARGPDGIFSSAQVTRVIAILKDIRRNAEAA
jgi:type I restriction enzyme R subunit